MAVNGLSPVPKSIPVDFEIDKIRGIIADYVGVNVTRVIDEAHFCDDLGLDWLECLELVLRIEDETGVEIPESAATPIENVGHLLRQIEFAIKNEKSVAGRRWGKDRSPATPRLRVGKSRPASGDLQLEMANVGADVTSAGKTRRTCNC